MRSHQLAAAAGVLALTLVAACNDESPRPEAAVAPTANETSALTPDAGPNMAVAIGNQIASICKTYRKSAVQAKKDLIKDPNNAKLQAEIEALDEMIDDACN
jgi:hypothetical protein